MKRRVVVTGLGVLTSNAEDAREFSEALCSGRSGISEISQFDTGPYSCKIAGEVKSRPLDANPTSELDRASELALHAAVLAIQDARLTAENLQLVPLGVVVGTTCGGVLSLEKVSEALVSQADLTLIPDWRIRELSFFAPTQHVARRVKATGPVVTVTVACASGAHAIGMGTDWIRYGRTPLVLAGGVDVVSRFIFRGFAALNGLGSPPYTAFDKHRSGVVLGEGAGFVVLEELEHALARGAQIYAEVLGHSFNNDGAHIVYPNPTGEGIARSFRMAIEDAGLQPRDIAHVNAHGTGTIANDQAESAAMHLTFGERTQEVPVTSIKPMIGHTSGAAGSIEAIAAILSMRNSFIPATLHYQTPDPACDVNIVAALQRSVPLPVVLSANSGFGGSNAAVLLGMPGAVLPDASSPEIEAQEVVISGLGVLLPCCETKAGLWEALKQSTPAVPEGALGLEVPEFDLFDRTGLPISKDSRRMDRFSQNACMAAFSALQDAGIDGERSGQSLGLVLGSAYACLESNEKFSAGLNKVKVNPVVYQNTVSNAVTGYLCILMGIRGPVSVINQGEISGASALAYGFELVRNARCKAVLVGGTERLCQMTGLSLERLGMKNGSSPALPYSDNSAGLVPSDGSAFLVLESRQSAEARGAHIYCRVTGYGFSSAGGQPPEQAIERSTRAALTSLSGPPSLHVLGNGCGVPRVDHWELEGLRRGLATFNGPVSLSSPKAALGDTLGASGAVAAVIAALSLEQQLRPGSRLESPSVAPTPLQWQTEESAGPLGAVLVSSVDEDGACVTLALGAISSSPN